MCNCSNGYDALVVVITTVILFREHQMSETTPVISVSEGKTSLWDRFTPHQLKHLAAGGVAGAVSRTSVSPFERLKILYQVSCHCMV